MFEADNGNYYKGRNAFSVNSTRSSPSPYPGGWQSVPYGMGLGTGFYYNSQFFNDWRNNSYLVGNAASVAFEGWAFIGFKVGSDNKFRQFIGDKNNPVLEGIATTRSYENDFNSNHPLMSTASTMEIGSILKFPPSHWAFSAYSYDADIFIENLVVMHKDLTLSELDNIRINGISPNADGVVAYWFKNGSLNDESPTGCNLVKTQTTNLSGSLVTLPS